MASYRLSIALASLSAFLLGGWIVWAIVGATTGWGKLSYAGAGFSSPQVGGLIAFASLIVLVRSQQVGRPTRYAALALVLSLLFAVVPLVTFLAVCDNCIQ